MRRPGPGPLPLVVALLVVTNGLVAGIGLARHDAEAPPVALRAAAPSGPPPAVIETATDFLAAYVAEDGRVVRHDQGGDTVSEGQAYAMLVAVGVEDRATFDRVWRWTREHLRRPDGLLSWRWADGSIVDAEAAADADLDAAWALAIAARRWPDGPYRDAARELAGAVEAHEVVTVGDDRVLVAGPWAVADHERGGIAVVNPSYASPVAAAVLVVDGHLPTGPTARRRAGDRSVAEVLVERHGVPTDWVRIDDAGPHAARSASEAGPGAFGWDAVRVPLRYAPSCDSADRQVAARTWPAIEAGAGFDRLGDHPARLVGAAAAATAAGEETRAGELLGDARRVEERASTYYGSALTALGHLLLMTDRLGGCPSVTIGERPAEG